MWQRAHSDYELGEWPERAELAEWLRMPVREVKPGLIFFWGRSWFREVIEGVC